MTRLMVPTAIIVGILLWATLLVRASADPCFWAAIDGPSNTDYVECGL